MKRWIHASTSSASAIDVTTTGTSYYDSFLNESDLKYMENAKNRTGKIVKMSPNDYFEECAESIFNGVSVSNLKEQRRRDKESLYDLQMMLNDGKKFWLPYINIADNGQEGLHRMMVLGDVFGWDTEFPVLIVQSVDPRSDIVKEAFRQLNRAVSETEEYKFRESKLPEEFIDQVQWELERYDEETTLVAKTGHQTDSGFSVTLEGFEDDINIDVHYDQLRLKADSDDDFEIDYDDLDVEDLGIEDMFFK